MNRIFTGFCVLSLSTILLAGCSSSSSSSLTPASSSAPVSTASVSAPAASSAITESSSSATSGEVEAMLATLSEAAGVTDGIALSEIDLQANGLDTTNVLVFAGTESRLSSENGGIVMVFQVEAGSEAATVTALEAYRDLRASDDRYAEFATARENTAQARIGSVDDYVYYAVSSTGESGGYDTLDAAIATLTAKPNHKT